jgi:hypothetical protein
MGREPPPFIVAVDVGHCYEFCAFPSWLQSLRTTRSSIGNRFEIYLVELRKPEARKRLVAVWTDPKKLDPAEKSARRSP